MTKEATRPILRSGALISAFVALSAFGAVPAEAQNPVVEAQMLGGWQTDSGSRMAAAQFTLSPEWKTYWRAPGDAGIPPMFDWAGSENVASVRFHWPRPIVFDFNGMRTIGYRNELVLPIEVTPKDPSQPIKLRASVDIGVCRDICVPATIDLRADLDGQGAPDGTIKAALGARPATAREAGVAEVSCAVEPISDGLRVTARVTMPALGADEVVVIEPGGAAPVWVSEATVTRRGGELVATADLVPDRAGFALDRSQVTLTVLGDDRAVEIRGCPAP
ncbi:hypothetical protein E7811_05245 [Aliigemmobacter aestuarii]|uniref:Thiol:disulfide interchange protein DsbD N-terminal domain-containing protein n=1 Tax=Aliigemmobacter aestuarii TaxID=1445661 RepID=A0A4S3MUC1_9RHOB|nr:protein-disulfide reductase DsbD domain-containing protein [Gemmobacter aestuarii]THD85121.1 hypothetical protein E7811_05245 [Gemmobacter aestuarii]